MPTANRSEYLEIDGLPLATAAWEILNLEVLWQAANPRGDSDVIPYRRGRQPRRGLPDSRRETLQMVIEGTFDSDGNPATPGSERAQLEANINELKTILRARQNTVYGDVSAVLHTPNRNLTGPAQVRTGLQLGQLGPAAVNATFDLELTDGVLYDEDNPIDVTSASVPGGGSDTLNVPNPGTADQFAVIVDLTGTATSVKLTNLTWDPDETTFLEFGGALEDSGVGTTIDTGAFTAVRNSVSVIGLITHSGHETWLPLLAGQTNTIRIEPVGGTATLQIQHTPAYE